MCIPMGPRGGGYPGRTAFTTAEDVVDRYSLEIALKVYPDNDAAMTLLTVFIDDHIEHTEKWMIDRLAGTEPYLIRIGVIPENLTVLKTYYRHRKAAWKAEKTKTDAKS